MKFEELTSQEDLDKYIQAQTQEAVEKAVGEVEGLKAKNAELLSEKKAEAQRRKDAEEAAKAKELDAARNAGKIEEVEKALSEKYESQIAQLNGQVESLNGEILSGKASTVLESLAGKFVSPDAAKLMLQPMIDVQRSENGVVTSFKGLDGNVITTDPKEFSEYLASEDAFKSMLKGVESSGGGANGGQGDASGAGGSRESMQANLRKRLKKSGVL